MSRAPASNVLETEIDEKIDVEAIMARIREEVREDLERSPENLPYYRRPDVAPDEGSAIPPIYSAELNYLNAHWGALNQSADITSHRPIIGRLVVFFKRLIAKTVWNAVLKDYFEREREYQMNLVRFLNSTSRYIEKRDAEIFWDVVKKIDNDIHGVNDRIDRLYDEAMGTLRTVERGIAERLGKFEGDRDALLHVAERTSGDVNQLDDVLRGLERTVALFGRELKVSSSISTAPASTSSEDIVPRFSGGVDYLLLENRYRGSEELIKDRLRDYLDLFLGANGPVIELGCGRGEFLELLRSKGVQALGVDMDDAMIARCEAKGLEVINADCISYLENLEDGSIGGIFAAQLVEHLTREQLEALSELANRKVKRGGRIAFETINPQSLTALCRNFFRDPTHVWPLHPDTLRFVMEMKGIRTESIKLRSPYPQAAILQHVPISEFLPARWRATLQGLNDNVTRLNDLLFGHQDYCIIGVAEDNRIQGRTAA